MDKFGFSSAPRYAAPLFALVLAAISPDQSSAEPDLQMRQGTTSQTMSVDSATMLARVRETGSIRVIIGYGESTRPEGDLDGAAVDTQRAFIASEHRRVEAALGDPEVVHEYTTIPYSVMVLSPEQFEALLELQGITSISEDVPEPAMLDSSVPLIGANRVWRAGVTGEGWNIAVLDSGISYGHQAWNVGTERNGAIVTAACFSTNSASSQARSLCRGGASSEINRVRAAPACDVNLTDGCGHGTHVAGTAMAHRPLARRGVARESGVIPIQVFSMFYDYASSCQGDEYCVLAFQSDQIAALDYVATIAERRRIAAVNMSLGGGSYYSHCDAQQSGRAAVINNLRSIGVATIVSSGNWGYTSSIGAPACIEAAIAVGATDDSDNIASFSNQAAGLIDLMAPGVGITAPFPGSRTATATWQGTSMAAPHVAGAFALLRSAVPSATVTDIERALECTGVTVSREGTSGTFLRINVSAARRFLMRGRSC
ncbi:S8 family serine peptidase [Cereibacter sphaeroides]|nr:S8 family serine peptidase [Cereibacter sphaeroides]